jgi:antitoxin component YwqK of YwqJK toxin-antitoxin module
MKTCFLLLFFALFPFEGIWAQSKYCDELVQRGDTVVCREYAFKRKLPSMEHFYVHGKRIFSRDWNQKKNGEYYWKQQISKGAFVKANGPAYRFYPNGSVKVSTTFKHNKIVGPCKEFYPSGAIRKFCSGHIKGKIHGIDTYLHENGALNARIKWESGRLVEILDYKDEQGNDLPIGTFKNGTGDLIWVEKGKETLVLSYRNGKLIKKKPLKN